MNMRILALILCAVMVGAGATKLSTVREFLDTVPKDLRINKQSNEVEFVALGDWLRVHAPGADIECEGEIDSLKANQDEQAAIISIRGRACSWIDLFTAEVRLSFTSDQYSQFKGKRVGDRVKFSATMQRIRFGRYEDKISMVVSADLIQMR